MNIIEAIRSGKRFKRKDWQVYYENQQTWFSREDIVAFDWEVEDVPVTFTKEQFCEAWEKAVGKNDGRDVMYNGFTSLRYLVAKELGL